MSKSKQRAGVILHGYFTMTYFNINFDLYFGRYSVIFSYGLIDFTLKYRTGE